MTDSLTLFHLTKELQALKGGRIDKVNMPNPHDVVLLIKNGGLFNLLISCNPSRARIYLTESKVDNPLTPFSFLMHLRKHITGGIIKSVTQLPYERVIALSITSTTLLTEQSYTLYAEIMGKHSNIILTDSSGKITDSAIHVSADTSSKRMVLPSLSYSPPPPQEGKFTIDDEQIFIREVLGFDGKVSPHNFLISKFVGFSPASMREAVARSGFAYPVTKESAQALRSTLVSFFNDHTPTVVKHGNTVRDFYPFEYVTAPSQEIAVSLNKAMDEYYGSLFTQSAHEEKSKKLEGAVKGAISRNEKKLASIEEKNLLASDCESDRIFGELITANIYKIRYGDEKIKVFDYYSSKEVEIPLDKMLSPSQNAQRYYKKYSKKKKTLEMNEVISEKTQQTLEYLESLLVCINQAKSRSDLEEIEKEMQKTGLLPTPATKKATNKTSSKPRKFVVDGYTVLIGKNNLQNDELVKSSDGGYTWLHTQKIHGSHTVICGKNLDISTIEKVARYSAFYSKASMSDNVPVDYTLIKHVKKPTGALPGKVIYTHQQTLFVSPKNPETDEGNGL